MVEPDPSSVRHPGPWQHLDVRGNGIRLHVAECGPTSPDAPLVVLIHGFAQYWWSWRHQLVTLGEAGYRTVAVDLRGYGDSDKPPRGYDGWTLSGDISGLIRGLGHDEATLIGHADGGLICWAGAALHPKHVTAIATIAAPHPLGLRRATFRDAPQRAALAPAMVRNQIPRLAEHRLATDNGAGVEALLKSRAGGAWTQTEDFSDTVHNDRSAIQIAGAAHCALEYHRWAFRSQFRPDGARFREALHPTIRKPVLELRGADDPYVLPGTFSRCTEWAPDRRLATFSTGHFVHQEAPDDVTASLLGFLRR